MSNGGEKAGSWWYVSDGERKGPVSDVDLHRLLISGTIKPNILVWKAGMAGWQPADKIQVLAPMLASVPPPVPPPERAIQQPTAAGALGAKARTRHHGSTIAIVVGALLFLTGLSLLAQHKGGPYTDLAPEDGILLMLAGLAYRSAKKRKLGEVKSTLARKFLEALLFPICIFVMVMNVRNPISNFLIPVGAMIAYLIVVFIPGWPAPAGKTPRQSAQRSQPSFLVYLLLFVAVSLGMGWYIHGWSDGLVYYMGAEAFAAAVAASLIAFAIAYFGKEPIRYDLVFLGAVFFLLSATGRQILEAYDARQFASEIRSSGPADFWKSLANSETQLGAILRGTASLAQEANSKIDAIFAELNDPLLDNALTLETLGNQVAISQTQKMAEKKLILARTAMQRVDPILANALQQTKQLAAGLSEMSANDVIRRFKDIYALARSFDQREADLHLATLEEISATLAFFSSRAGSYQIANGTINFERPEDIETYNTRVSKMEAIAGQKDQLIKDWQANQEGAAGRMFGDSRKSEAVRLIHGAPQQ
jgi:hypothetical protein